MLLDDVVVVEEPVAGRSDVRLRRRGRGQPLVRGVEDALGAFQAREQRGAVAPPATNQCLRSRMGPRAFREMLGAEQLTANRASERFVSVVDDGGKEPGRERAWKGDRWNGDDQE